MGAAVILLSSLVARGEAIDFNRDIRPILSDKCFFCHGPDSKHRKADLRLDTFEGAIEDHDGVRAIDPDHPANSELLFRIETDDEDELMPPPDSNKTLTAEEIALLKQWVAAGAPWAEHWSFVPPSEPGLPEVSEPEWARTPVDRFILRRLDERGMKPAGEASRRELIRRVSLDLTGMPPTPDEVAAFLADDRPDAWESLVDRLLASPRFGEHMARYWLDAVRYGDTHGLHLDNYREIWPYRDWVVGAFNANKPFDEFVTEQLAGDLLPDASAEQLVATGFLRTHVTTSEGGSIAEEVYVRNVKERVDNFGTVFLGLTANCASCHDHKYDPLAQSEYYSLFAYFNSLDANPLDGNKKDHEPVIRVPMPGQEEEIAELRRRIDETREEIRQEVAAVDYREPETPAPPALPEPEEFVWIDEDTPEGATRGTAWNFVKAPGHPVFSGEQSHTQTAEGLQQHFFTGAAKPLVIHEGDRLFAHVFIDPKTPPKEIMLQWNETVPGNAGGNWNHRAYWGENVIDWGQDGTPSRRRIGDLPAAGEWVRLEVAAADVGLAPGARVNGWAFTQFDGTVHWDRSGIVSNVAQDPTFDSFREWIQFQRGLEQPTVPDEIAAILRKPTGELSEDERRAARDHFIEHAWSGGRERFASLHARIDELGQRITQAESQFATTLVWKERPEPKDSFLLDRGEYDRPQDKVERIVPAFLPPMPEGAPNDRLGLARWLLAEEHPLFARVAVNRFWQQLFGTGIVKTAGDFGQQGEPPSHPELLDWLAVRFRADGWDVKALMRELVLSSTYRQSSSIDPAKLTADPENRLLARGPRFRLDAETLRDQALAVSGLLVEKLGGPSVKPPQPDGLWFAVAYTSSNTARFKADEGPDKVHRRSLYTFWKRTAPPPQMNIFDAPSREATCVRRERTNTPLQALLLLNDPQYFEAARALGLRALREGGATPEERIAHVFELATCRPPTADEVGIIHAAYLDHAREFAGDPERAKRVIQVGATPPPDDLDPAELATWTLIGNLILNLDEVVTKG